MQWIDYATGQVHDVPQPTIATGDNTLVTGRIIEWFIETVIRAETRANIKRENYATQV